MIRLSRDFEPFIPGAVAVGIAVLIGATIGVVSHGVNRPPVITRIRVDPPAVAPGKAATVHVEAQDPDGERLAYSFAAESGRVQVADASRPEARYMPAERSTIVDRITVTVTDTHGYKATGSQIVTIEGAVTGAAGGASAGPAPEPQASLAPPPPGDASSVPNAAGNRPPVLNGGRAFYDAGDKPVRLEATGSDPDGDRISFSWDFGHENGGPCLLSSNVEVYHAEVRLRPGCDKGTATLKWTDEHGAAATAQWDIQR